MFPFWPVPADALQRISLSLFQIEEIHAVPAIRALEVELHVPKWAPTTELVTAPLLPLLELTTDETSGAS